MLEYLSALHARRKLALEEPQTSGGKPLRGTARANVLRAAQRRLDAAEAALIAAMGDHGVQFVTYTDTETPK